MDKLADLFDRWHTEIIDRNSFLTKIRYYSLQRYIIRVVANICIPIYYYFTRKNSQLEEIRAEKRLIVSLTTFPARIGRVWIVIESLIRQTYKPDMIILWLSKKQFSSIEQLPKELVKQTKRGLIIRFVDEDIKSHKKYFYTLKEFPDDYLITVDDDIIYPTFLIEKLIKLNQRFPGTICCHRAKVILRTLSNELLPYNEWIELQEGKGPGFNIFQTSGGGTLFPPYSLSNEVLNKDVFLEYTPYADDIWLNYISRLNKIPIAKTSYYSTCLSLLYRKDKRLADINNNNNGNDKQLAAVRKYYRDKLSIDPFKTI